MNPRYFYDERYDPPIPVIALTVSLPTGGDTLIVSMIIDTGADITLMPASVVHQLGLPEVDVIRIRGVDDAGTETTVHDAAIAFGRFRSLVRVVAFADEAILGRDVLNQLVTTLDGPKRTLSFGASSRAPHQSRPR